MRRRKVVAFHVGAHKTGTSAIQHYLHGNRPLLERHRVALLKYSDLGETIGWGEHLLADPRPLQAHLDRFRRDRRHRVLIASHENIVGPPFTAEGGGGLYPEAARNLAALGAAASGGMTVKAVLSIRPVADFLESYYLQTVHQGHHDPFEVWLAGVDLTALSWRPLIEAARAAFGPGGVEILDFRSIRAGQAAYIRQFLLRVDPALDIDVEHATPRNRSISERGLAMALAANPFLENWPERKAMRDFLQQHFSNVDFPRPVLLSATQRADLADRYDAEYDDLVGGPPPAPPVPISAVSTTREGGGSPPGGADPVEPAGEPPACSARGRQVAHALDPLLGSDAERALLREFLGAALPLHPAPPAPAPPPAPPQPRAKRTARRIVRGVRRRARRVASAARARRG